MRDTEEEDDDIDVDEIGLLLFVVFGLDFKTVLIASVKFLFSIKINDPSGAVSKTNDELLLGFCTIKPEVCSCRA